MNIQKLTIILLFPFVLISCFWENKKEENINKKEEKIQVIQTEKEEQKYDILSWDIETLEKLLPSVPKQDVEVLQNAVKEDDFIKIQQVSPGILENLKKQEEVNEKVVEIIKYNYVSSILNEWNYFYKEDEKSKEAIEYLQDPDYVDPFYNNYYLWYANEIIKKYEEALEYYNKALDYAWDAEKNKVLKSVILNQIGHLYDLQWNIEKAQKNYYEAYSLDSENYSSSVNIARYLLRIWDIEWAKKYFEYWLWTRSNISKSEIYFSLSSLELEYWDIESSKEYAKLSIQHNHNYPMGYIALARSNYMLNSQKYYIEIEKLIEQSLQLYKDNYLAYRILGLHMYDQKNQIIANALFEKSKQALQMDMILMDNQRDNLSDFLQVEQSILNLYFKIDTNFTFTNYVDYIIENWEKNPYLKKILSFQLKRKDYGIFKERIQEKDFWKLLQYLQ